MKVNRKELLRLLESFNVDATNILLESKVTLNNKLARYAKKILVERTKLPKYVYKEDGVTYTLEVDSDVYYYLTRNIDNNLRRIILKPDEIEIIQGKEDNQEALKELAYYTDHVAARFGL